MEVQRGAPPRYRVLRPILYPTDQTILARIRQGERVPMAERGLKRVPPGRVVTDIPQRSIPWLIEQGCIERVGEGDRDG